MATGDSDHALEDVPVAEEHDDHRDAWLEMAASDVDGGALAALATAARGGLVQPKE